MSLRVSFVFAQIVLVSLSCLPGTQAQQKKIIIDGSAVPVAYAADAVNITRAFVREFNAKNVPAVGPR